MFYEYSIISLAIANFKYLNRNTIVNMDSFFYIFFYGKKNTVFIAILLWCENSEMRWPLVYLLLTVLYYLPTSQTCNDFSTFLSINYENKLFRKIQLIQESKNFENTNETVWSILRTLQTI